MAYDRGDKRFDIRSERLYGLYQGIVKDNQDFQNMGRLGVWIPELCGTPEQVISVIYASPFAGATNIDENSSDERVYDGTQESYGFWAVPPDLNNVVLVMFINGHISKGVWLSCLYQHNMNHMVPNIPVGDSYQIDGKKVPVAEYNKKATNATNAKDGPKPFHKPHYESIRNQGLKDDPVRGFSQHGARSEKSSKVSGMLSPGGHYWTLEDTTDDEKIRLRTKSGVQLLLDESRGLVYVINKSGTGWVEIDDNGKIMVYGEQGIGLRSQGDINLRADKDLIFESGRNTYMKSVGNMHIENNSFYTKTKDEYIINVANIMSEKVGKKHIKSEDDMQIIVTTDYKLGTNSYHVNSSTVGNITTGTDINLSSGATSNFSSAAATSILSGANLSAVASGTFVQVGSTILQNTGGGGSPAQPADASSPEITTIPDLDTYQKKKVSQPHSNSDATITDVDSIVTIFPSHEPCPEHDNDPEDRG